MRSCERVVSAYSHRYALFSKLGGSGHADFCVGMLQRSLHKNCKSKTQSPNLTKVKCPQISSACCGTFCGEGDGPEGREGGPEWQRQDRSALVVTALFQHGVAGCCSSAEVSARPRNSRCRALRVPDVRAPRTWLMVVDGLGHFGTSWLSRPWSKMALGKRPSLNSGGPTPKD